MNGTGTDIWGVSDQFRFAYKVLKGNGSIVARVDSVANTDAWAKAGVMIRESVDSASTHAMTVVSPTSGASFQRRMATAGDSTSTDVTGLAAPYWVKVTRNGSTFTAQGSADGVTWSEMTATPAVTITMANDVLIGLAVTSHTATAVCGAAFSNVSTTGNVYGQWQVAEVGAPQAIGNSPETFYVSLQDAAGRAKTVTCTDPTMIATGAWQQWSIPFSQFSSAGVNLGAVKKMVIGVGDRVAPKAGSTGKLYIDDIRLTRLETP
jgi:regulation of enolase protein 1 (concanavalin A-like superfamily)